MNITEKEQNVLRNFNEFVANDKADNSLSDFKRFATYWIKDADDSRLEKLWEHMNSPISSSAPNQNNDLMLLKDKSAIKQLLKFDPLKENNTIPKGPKIKITFHENLDRFGTYMYGNTNKPRIIVKAVMHYHEDAVHNVLGVEYPLALSKCGILGLYNYLNHKQMDANVKGNTFEVQNVNDKTYKWRLVKD